VIAIVHVASRFVAVSANGAGSRFSTPVEGGGRYEGESASAVGRYALRHSPGVRGFMTRAACVSAALDGGCEEDEILPGIYGGEVQS
jgi:hypothetical protein